MKEYNKPLIDVVRERAEGVYATSGTGVATGCQSQYMNGVYHHPNYKWNTSVMEYYGCAGCSACREYGYNGSAPGCAWEIEPTYVPTDTQAPDWETQYKVSPDRMVDDANGLVY